DSNLYRYVFNRTLGLTDPTGLATVTDGSWSSGGLVLPDDPSGLPDEWVPDPSHRYPNGQRFRHPNGDYLDWHPGRPGKPGWGGRDHWHHNGGKPHLKPGEVVQVTQIVVGGTLIVVGTNMMIWGAGASAVV